MGPASALWDHPGLVIRIDPATFALRRDDGRLVVVDTRDGSSPRVEDDAVGWCFEESSYDDGPLRRLAADFAEPDDNAGISVGDVFVWMDAHGLHAAR